MGAVGRRSAPPPLGCRSCVAPQPGCRRQMVRRARGPGDTTRPGPLRPASRGPHRGRTGAMSASGGAHQYPLHELSGFNMALVDPALDTRTQDGLPSSTLTQRTQLANYRTLRNTSLTPTWRAPNCFVAQKI